MATATLRAAGHDVVFMAERDIDPGDLEILREANSTGSVLITKDTDIGTLVSRDKHPHAGVLLIDDLGSAQDETDMLVAQVNTWSAELASGAFIRAGLWGSKLASQER